MEKIKIRCPKCDWKPDGESRWICIECGFHFHTFETDRICPKCGKYYPVTQCLGCKQFSDYGDWFEQE